ncbi:right-handed parallel beta-helix repeat-containing protein [Treponema sp. Marseille-Q4130]|uniref:right-handed parallel beta-helix repeat-containing protein n=1 Tax=Treponema sp. Marseille-Q4130 TaxID=2766702 RepID=UPI0016520A39|nr:right-handed parallel beta-helix repeat-containing protein [Treponema sp. Marseille-Q4130]MBC6719020.1 hypothetical protein [Treponema sp. Marseille-Q4130]
MKRFGKNLIRAALCATGITLLFCVTSCKELFADIEENFSYWTSGVAATDSVVDVSYQKSEDGTLCIPSSVDVPVTIKLLNPKKFRLVMPASSSDEKVIRFSHLSPQPMYGTDYTLQQTADDVLTLTYKSAFLKRHEWGNGNIGADISFISTDGRVFGKGFSINIRVNTAPVLEAAGIAKTRTADPDGNYYYVLLFRVKDMDSPITDSSVHKDITALNVTAGGVPSEIPLSFNSAKRDFERGENLLEAGDVQKLDPSDPELPSGSWILRLKTDVKVGGAAKEYAVSVKDAQGLSSAVIQTSTQKTKLAVAELLDGLSPITGTAETNPKNFPGISGKTISAKALGGALITGTVEKYNGADWNQAFTVSGITPVSIHLPALDTGETEAFYKIILKAQLTGYDDSDEQTFFVKLLRQEVPVLKIKQDFAGANDLHSISAAAKGYVSEDIISDAGYYHSTATALGIYNKGGTAKLSITVNAGATVKYKLNSGSEMTTGGEIAIAAGPNELEVWAVRGGVEGPHTTVHIKLINAVTAYGELKNTVQNAPEQGTGPGQHDYSTFFIDINIGTDLTADTETAVIGGKKLILSSSSSGTVRTVNAGGNRRIFKISDTGSRLELQDIKLEGGYAADGKGGAVCVEAGGALGLTDKTVITPSTGSDVNTRGKNDVYLANGTQIILDGPLLGTTPTNPIVARITPETYSETVQVLGGGNLGGGTPPAYTKFTVTQPTDSDSIWKIKSDGKLQKISSTINGSDSLAWKKLLDAVREFPEGSTIVIDGLIQATNEAGNFGEIVINKNLKIKGKTGAGTDILDANASTLGTNAHRIFKVENGKTLTLEKLTLKNGKDQKGGGIYAGTGTTVNLDILTTIQECKATDGGAIYNDGGTLTIKGASVIKGNEVTNNGGAFLIKSGSLHMENNCIVEQNKAKKGGGIYITNSGTATILYCRASENEAQDDGGGVYIDGGSLTLEGSTIGGQQFYDGTAPDKTKGNKAKKGGGIYLTGSGVVCTMTGGKVSYNKASEDGGGVYADTATLKMSGSATVNPNSQNQTVYLKNGAKIHIEGALTGAAPVACITPESYAVSVKVLDGAITAGTAPNQNYTKFTVTPNGTEEWEIKSDGYLIKVPVIIDGTKPLAWKKLLDAVADAQDGDVITITGAVQAKNEGTGSNANRGEIVINKSLTIKGKTGATSDILDANANNLGSDAHRIFKVASGKTLTLENLTLKNGQGSESGNTDNGGAVYVKGGTVEMTLCTLTGNKADKGGAVYAEKDGSTRAAVTLKGCTIGGTGTNDANKAIFGSDQEGGGLYIGELCTLKLDDAGSTGCTVQGNTAMKGGGIYAAGIAQIKGTSKIVNNTADHLGGGIYSEGSLTLSGDVLIKGNSASDQSALGGGVYVGGGTFAMSERATVTPSTGENTDKPRENDVYLATGKKITLSGALYPQGGGKAARITPQNYTSDTQVLDGAITEGTVSDQNYTRFTITPQEDSGNTYHWETDKDGKIVRLVEGGGTKPLAWKALKDTVAAAQPGDTIVIKFTITATKDPGNFGEIVIDKNLTIKNTLGGILDANASALGSDAHRIFKVESGAKLTLERVGLKGGKATGSGDQGFGGALYIEGTVEMTGAVIYGGNTAIKGGGVYVTGSGAVLTMDSCQIHGNIARSPSTHLEVMGGGVCVANGATFNMNNGSIYENQAIASSVAGSKAMGGGVCVAGSGSTFVMKDSSETRIYGNEVKKSGGTNITTIGGGVCVVDGASFTMEKGYITENKAVEGTVPYFGKVGGGVCVGGHGSADDTGYTDDNATFTMKGGMIRKNEAGAGGGVAVMSKASFIMKGGTIGGEEAYANKATGTGNDGFGGGVAVMHGTFTMEGESSIVGNTADGSGGGIYGMKMNGNEGEIIIKGSSIIKRNTANVSNSPAGGGIYASHKLTVEGSARIENNKAPNGDGGGIVCTNNAQVDFAGGTITGNTATRYGKGVYISPLSSGAFNMSGGAKADTNNDVYLDASGSDSAKITVNSSLTPAGGTAARITVPDANYQTTTQVLTGSAVGSEYGKFTVTPQDSGGGNVQNWKVDSSGNLQTQ